MTIGIILVLVLIVLLLLTSCVKVVPQAYGYVIERLGGYQTTLGCWHPL